MAATPYATASTRVHWAGSLADGAAGHRAVLADYSPAFLDQMIAMVTRNFAPVKCH